MFGNIKAALLSHLLLTLFDFVIEKLFHAAAVQADQVVVMRAFIQFEHRLAGFKMVSMEQAGLFELGKHAIYRRQADVHVFCQQDLVYVLGAQVTNRAVLENIENLESRQGGLQATGF